jgi:hypothetical protein
VRAEDFELFLVYLQLLSLVSSQNAVTSANGGAEWGGGRSVAEDDEVSKSAKITAD